MPDQQEKAGEVKFEEATVGVKANVRSLQQMSSSGRAAQRKRQENHAQKAFSALDAALEKHLKEEAGGSGGESSK